MRNIEKKIFQGLKRQNKLFANTICIKKMFAETSDLNHLKNTSSKTETKTQSTKILLSQDLEIEQAQTYFQLGISK